MKESFTIERSTAPSFFNTTRSLDILYQNNIENIEKYNQKNLFEDTDITYFLKGNDGIVAFLSAKDFKGGYEIKQMSTVNGENSRLYEQNLLETLVKDARMDKKHSITFRPSMMESETVKGYIKMGSQWMNAKSMVYQFDSPYEKQIDERFKIVRENEPSSMQFFGAKAIADENNVKNGGTLMFSSLAPTSDFTYFLYDEENVAGYLSVCDYESGYYINQIALKKSLQGKGLGKHLMDKLVEDAFFDKKTSLAANIAVRNEHSKSFHTKYGFKNWEDSLYLLNVEKAYENLNAKENTTSQDISSDNSIKNTNFEIDLDVNLDACASKE